MEDTITEDLKELMGTTEPAAETPATPTPEPTPEPKAEDTPAEKTAEEPKPEEKPEATPEPKAPETWNKALAKTQKELAIERKEREADRKELAETRKLLQRLAQHAGLEPEPEPTPEPTPEAKEPSPESARIAKLERELEFGKLSRQLPGVDIDKLDDDAWNETLELFGIDKDATEAPAGITSEALTRARDSIFQRKITAIKAEKKPPASPAPPRNAPAKTPAGKSVAHVPVSHVPAQRTERDDVRRDIDELLGR